MDDAQVVGSQTSLPSLDGDGQSSTLPLKAGVPFPDAHGRACAVDYTVQSADLRLSVIITCFNYRDFVARAIESVLRQENPRCELIVVDDGSTDGSWDVIRGYGLPKCVRVDNGGQLQACRHGLEWAAGPFVLFLDADDELAPGSLAEIMPQLVGSVAKLQFALTPIDVANRVLGMPFPALADAPDRVAYRREVLATGVYRSPPTSGNVFRRDMCNLLGQVDYETSVDGVMLFIAPFLGDIVSLPRALGFYRVHARNTSQAGSAPTAARFRMEAERFLLRHDHLRRLLEVQGVGDALVEGRSAFFYRERRLYQAVLEGDRPRFRDVAALHRMLRRLDGSARRQWPMILLLWLLFVLPQNKRMALLTYRMGLRHRSAYGLVMALLGRQEANA